MSVAPGRVRKVALLTSGGDCSGLNAIIRAVVLRASQLGWEVTGISYGTQGLLGEHSQTRLGSGHPHGSRHQTHPHGW